MKKNKNSGFTLVELIVVLVILAVLAAMLVPSLTGYIDKARKSQVIAETRMLTQAAQTELSALYATDDFQSAKSKATILTVAAADGTPVISNQVGDLKANYDDIMNLAELSSLTSANGKGKFFVIADFSGAVRWTAYYDGKGYYGFFCREDNSMTAFTKDEVPYFDNYNTYFGKVVCTTFSENYYDTKHDGSGAQTRNFWSKNTLFALLGIQGYTPDVWG